MRFKKLFGDSPIGRGRGNNLKMALGDSPCGSRGAIWFRPRSGIAILTVAWPVLRCEAKLALPQNSALPILMPPRTRNLTRRNIATAGDHFS